MKKSRILCSILVLCLCLSFGLVLAGCGSTSTTTLAENFTTMFKALSDNEYLDIQENEKKEPLINTTDYYTVSYGTVIDDELSKASGVNENYKVLEEYNDIFSLAISYITENYVVITGYTDDDLNDATKNLTSDLNDKIENFTSEAKSFATAQSNLDYYFTTYYEASLTSDGALAQLRAFKKSYSSFVDSCVDLSLTLADVVDATGILATASNEAYFRSYACNKILQVYNEFLIVEIGTFNYAETPETTTKTRIDTIITNLETSFTTLSSILSSSSTLATLESDDRDALINNTSAFLTEVNSYLSALSALNVQSLCVEYANDLDVYMENANAYADVYFEKIEQFVETSLPNFLSYLNSALFA